MTTASALMGQLQTELGDEAGAKFTSTLLYGWLDEAQKDFALKTMTLRQVNGQSVIANQQSVPIASDCIMIDAVVSKRGWAKKVARVTQTDYMNQQTAVRTALATDPSIWTEIDQRVYVYPQYSASSLAVVLNASTTSAATTLTMASTGNLRSYGRVLLDSEEIEYTGKTSTTITGCRRGVDGTTAATHVSGASVSQVDLEIWYRRHAITLASTASPEIKPIYHEKLKVYAKYMAYLTEGSFQQAQEQYALWQRTIQDASYSAVREYLGPLHVRDVDSQLISGLYGPI